MKATVLVDSERPKVSETEVVSLLRKSGLGFSNTNPDLGIVVGGDGLFSYQGRRLSIPLLFVGTRSNRPTDSKAILSEVHLSKLEGALREIKARRFKVVKHKRLEVSVGGFSEDIFTDVSLEKGADSNCIRYELEVKGKGLDFKDFGVSNGIVITTTAGSTGYYSYLDKVGHADHFEAERYSIIPDDEVGVCHIAPTYTVREETKRHPLRYTVPWGSTFKITLVRDADAHLFGVAKSRKGVRITTGDVVLVGPSKNTTNVIRLESGHREPGRE